MSLSIVQTANQVPNTTKVTLPGLEFEHFDFNQADPYLAKVAGARGDRPRREPPAIISRTVGEIAKGIKPLGSRMLDADAAGLQGHATTPTARAQSNNLLKELGFKKGSDGYWHPTTGRRRART